MMRLSICVIAVLFSTALALEKNAECTTPNGESAKCIPIRECKVIEKAIAYLDKAAVEFAKKSQCGHDGSSPLVCCGSSGRPTPTSANDTSDTTEPFFALSAPETYPDYVEDLRLPDGTLCGLHLAENRKPNEKVAQAVEFPWTVALEFVGKSDNDTKDVQVLCSGTLINERYVLTSALCLTLPDFRLTGARLGESNFSSVEDCTRLESEKVCSKAIDISVQQLIPHPYFNKTTLSNNVGLIRLSKPAVYSEFIRALCLPPPDYPAPKVGTTMDTTDWGIFTEGFGVKSKGKVATADCGDTTSIFKDRGCYTNTGSIKKCGDPGNPLMRMYEKPDYQDEIQFYLEGITFGPLRENPCRYTKVSKYTNWIINQLKY